MEIKKIPFKAKNIILNILNNKEDEFYRFGKSDFVEELIKYNYLEKIKEDGNDFYYRKTDLIKRSSFEEIFLNITKIDFNEFKEKKILSFDETELNSYYELEEMLEALNDAYGYFNKVDIKNKLLKDSLIMHELCSEAGVNGVYAYGTDKLNKMLNENKEKEIFKMITGSTTENFDEFLKIKLQEKEIKKMKKLAEKYGYELSKKGE